MENRKIKKVFLGGTCNDSIWRELLIPMLKIDYYNPVVKDWTPECQIEEIKQRTECDYCLYVITPEMTGVYSIAEVVDDSNKRPRKTIFCVPTSSSAGSFTKAQLKSLDAVGQLVLKNGGKYFHELTAVAIYINSSVGMALTDKNCFT